MRAVRRQRRLPRRRFEIFMKAKLVVVAGQATKREVALTRLPILIGRNRNAGLPIAHALVSRNHCQLYELRGVLVIRDLGSANGTRVNGELIEECVLRPGDKLTVGPLTFSAAYEYAGDVPDLEILRLGGDDEGPPPFVEEVIEEAIAISDGDLMEESSEESSADAPLLTPERKPEKTPAKRPNPAAEKPATGKKPAAEKPVAEKPAGKPAAKNLPTLPSVGKPPAPPTKSPFKRGAGKAAGKAPDGDATLQWDSVDGDVMDLKLEDLLADSMVLKDKLPGKPQPAPKPTPEPDSESAIQFGDSGVQVRGEEDSIHSRPIEERLNPASQTPSGQEAAELSADEPMDLSEDFLLVEDSFSGELQDSGVGKAAKLSDHTPDLTFDSAIVDPDASSFDAVRLLTRTAPPDKNPRGKPAEDDSKPVISFVMEGEAWERSGIGKEQLSDKQQPTDFLLRLQLPDAGKLKVGTPVRVAGIEVGMVTDLNWVATGGHLRAEALLNIQKKLGEVLRDDFKIRVVETPDISVLIETPGISEKRLTHGQVVQPST
jgi:hypothetical protein